MTSSPGIKDVSDFLDAGGDVEELDREYANTPEWVPAMAVPEPYRDGREAMAAVRKMAKRAEDLRAGAHTLADEVAVWFDKRGDELLDKEYPVAYAAAALRIGRQYLYRLRDVGRVRRALRLSPTGDTIDELPDRVMRPLTKLLEHQADEIPGAFNEARKLAQAEEKPLTGSHTQRAVHDRLPCRPVGDTSSRVSPTGDTANAPPDADEQAVAGFCEQLHGLLDACKLIDVPPDLRHALLVADRIAQGWASKANTLLIRGRGV